jgi:hypothetical protein
MELRSPDFKSMSMGDEIFSNLPDELQKKYIGLGNELSAGMVRGLSPSGMSYYVSKKKEKLLIKSLKDLSENDMEVVLSKEMKPYLRSLKEKYRNELSTDFKPNFVGIAYPSDANAKYARMFGLEELFDLIPESTRFLITLNEGVKFVIQSLTLMNGREIFIPKMKSFKIISLAKTLLKTCKFKIIGLRPGEKLHEILFSKDESNNVIEFKKYYVLLPSSMINQKTLINKFKEKGIKLKYGFDYSSKNTSNDKFLKDKISP